MEQGLRSLRPLSSFNQGDRLNLKKNQILPFDSILESPEAMFDTSWVDGEPLPRSFHAGQKLSAGLRLCTEQAEMTLQSRLEESEIHQALQKGSQEALSQSQKLNRFDPASRKLLISVFLLALTFFFISPVLFQIGWEESFRRSLALIVIACPCALAFASPLAHSLALKKARQLGLLIKNTDVFHQVLESPTWIFDKTGTLTEGQLELVSSTPETMSPRLKDLILGLEASSVHPVAFAFRSAWGARSAQALPVHDVYEVESGKIFGVSENRLYTLRSSPQDQGGNLKVILERDHQALAEFEFQDRPRHEASALFRFLKKNKKQIYLLSGDHPERVLRLGKDLGLDETQIQARQTATQKLEFVQSHPNCIMIGDGINDAPSLACAKVGVAMNGALELSRQAGSVSLLRPGLLPLLDLFQLARQTQRVEKRNLSFALVYNFIAGACALLGYVNPLMAALLMPVSSLLLIASTWEGLR